MANWPNLSLFGGYCSNAGTGFSNDRIEWRSRWTPAHGGARNRGDTLLQSNWRWAGFVAARNIAGCTPVAKRAGPGTRQEAVAWTDKGRVTVGGPFIGGPNLLRGVRKRQKLSLCGGGWQAPACADGALNFRTGATMNSQVYEK